MTFNNGGRITSNNKTYKNTPREPQQPDNIHDIIQEGPTFVQVNISQENPNANTTTEVIPPSPERDLRFYPEGYDKCTGPDCNQCKKWYCVTHEDNTKSCEFLTEEEAKDYHSATEYETEEKCEESCYYRQSQYFNILP